MINAKKTDRDEAIAIIVIIEVIPIIFVEILLLTIKKGKISNIANARSLVSQWNPVGGEVLKNKEDALYSKFSCGVFPKIDAHFEYLEIGIWKDVNDSNKPIIISIIKTTVSTLNKVSSLWIVLTKNIIDSDKIEPHNK